MNLSTKQKQSYRCRNQTYSDQVVKRKTVKRVWVNRDCHILTAIFKTDNLYGSTVSQREHLLSTL